MESWSPWGRNAAGTFSGAGSSGEDFFPRFEAIPSGSLEAVLFSLVGGILDSSLSDSLLCGGGSSLVPLFALC